MVVDDDLGALLKTWNEVLEDLDGVLVALVVNDPAEVVDCSSTSVCVFFIKLAAFGTYHQHP